VTKDFSLRSVEVSLSPMERFEEFLQSRGKRNTEQRRILLDYVFRRHSHFDADMLIDQLPGKGEDGYLGRATVYRTLNELVDAGLLRKFDIDGRSVFEHDYGYPEHDHMHCQECERLLEFHSDELIKLREAVARDHNFRVTGHRLIISGVCDECNKSRRRKKRKQDLI
jgi:Fur family ferric uptake transcriptional regulator